jgi:hypothetical protein
MKIPSLTKVEKSEKFEGEDDGMAFLSPSSINFNSFFAENRKGAWPKLTTAFKNPP